MAASSHPARPSWILCVGVTGTRRLEAPQSARLAAQLGAVLQAVRQQVHHLAEQDQAARAAGRPAKGEIIRPSLNFLSPLARGADRLAAREALAQGYALHVPMPFPQAEYEKDFDTPEDLAEFRALLAKAGENRLALDGLRGPETDRAYEAVGRHVVHHSDLMIAIWDGVTNGGRGGTADIVRYAAAAGVPVWWLSAADDRAPVWVAELQDLQQPGARPPEAALQAYLKSIVPRRVEATRAE